MRRFVVVGAALAALWAASPGRAAAILSEPFNYPDGSLISVSGETWVHHSPNGSGTGDVQVVSGKAFLSQTNFEDVNVQLPGQPFLATNGTVLYASFTLNLRSVPTGSNGNYFAHFKDSGVGFRTKIFVLTNGAPAGSFRVGLANADNNVPSVVGGAILSLSNDYLVVARYVLSNAVSTVWINPQSESDPAITGTDAATTITVTSFALRESLATGNGMGSLFLDNLVIGTNFTDVLPNQPPVIVTQPEDQTAVEGADASFSVQASGTAPLAYQWQHYGTNLDGATDAHLLLTTVTTAQAGPYQVIVTNAFGATNSQEAQLLVIPPPPDSPVITLQPQSQTVVEGSNVVLLVTATGSNPLSYQWQFNGEDLLDQTNSSLLLPNISTNQAGTYAVTVTNEFGSTNSQPALVTVVGATLPALTVMTYNVKGNGATDWTTNAPQVQAIGRQLKYLQPDIITFNEIPYTFTYEMTNFVAAFLPGYSLATNSATDGFIRSVIAARFPILFSKSYLHSADLAPYGYTNSNFTRDLFQAQVAVPAFPQPLDVFVVHLKSGQGTDDSAKRAAEASAVSNFFATTFLSTNHTHPYYLAGDMNEDIDSPPASNPQSIQRLVNGSTGLHLTTPVNPSSGQRLTFSIQSVSGLTKRYDYIQPSGLLFSNITFSQVFRTDLLSNPPPPLLSTDDRTASDHLPVVMVFGNPYTKPFRLLSIERADQAFQLNWESIIGQPYRVEASSNLADWRILAGNLVATNYTFGFTGSVAAPAQFFRVGKE